MKLANAKRKPGFGLQQNYHPESLDDGIAQGEDEVVHRPALDRTDHELLVGGF